MFKIKGEHIHGINSLLTRINLTLYSINNKVSSPEDVKKIENSLRDIKILQRRVDNIFGLITFTEQINFAQINIESLIFLIKNETRGEKVITNIIDCQTKYLNTDIELFKIIIKEITMYYNILSFELLEINVESEVNCSEVQVIFKYRSDNLASDINRDMQDEQEIRKNKIIYISKKIHFDPIFETSSVKLITKLR